MIISRQEWDNYITKMSQLCKIAGQKMQEYVDKFGFSDREALIRYAHSLIVKYGESSAELACQMYDAVAELENAYVNAAEPVDVDDYEETSKTINGVLKYSAAGLLLSSAVERKVKQAGADTTLKNAIRDKAQVAWIAVGDTCPYCLVLAAAGWKNVSVEFIEDGHAKHIHAHCDCQYATRFNKNTKYDSYTPENYQNQIESAEGTTEKEKINSIRRINYQKNKELISQQRKAAYEKKKEENSTE